MENVTQVHGEDNKADFYKWIEFLESKGYSNYWEDLNAKDYGVAQNRDRCFMVSLLGEYNFHFPEPIPLTKTMKDYLEDEVDEKFYINNEKAKQLILELEENGSLTGYIDKGIGKHQSNSVFSAEGTSPCESASQYKSPIMICAE